MSVVSLHRRGFLPALSDDEVRQLLLQASASAVLLDHASWSASAEEYYEALIDEISGLAGCCATELERRNPNISYRDLVDESFARLRDAGLLDA